MSEVPAPVSVKKKRRRTPRWIKGLTRSDGFQATVAAIAAAFMRFVMFTSRTRYINEDIPRRFWKEEKPFLLALWHGRLLMMPFCWRVDLPFFMLVSQHRDGNLITRTINKVGISAIRGSSSSKDKNKGGTQALRSILKTLKQGHSVGITPDGPSGPRMHAGEGTVAIARLSGIPIIPATFATNRRVLAPSWDRFLVALPFGKSVFLWGDPIYVGRDDDLEAVRQQVEDTLNDLTARADEMVGVPLTQPAPKE